MTTHSLEGHLGRQVDIDECASCQVWWFDDRESLALSPRGTLSVFRVIGEHARQSKPALSPVLKCPRCASHLRPTHDKQRNVAFQYQRCPHGHGRLITDVDFLREKNLLRPLSAEQVDQLRASVHNVNCANCGGPIDLGSGSICTHCGSPLSMIDLRQAGDVIAQLQKADEGRTQPDPLLPLRLAEARREVERSFAELGHGAAQAPDSSVDLLAAGLSALAGWLKK